MINMFPSYIVNNTSTKFIVSMHQILCSSKTNIISENTNHSTPSLQHKTHSMDPKAIEPMISNEQNEETERKC